MLAANIVAIFITKLFDRHFPLHVINLDQLSLDLLQSKQTVILNVVFVAGVLFHLRSASLIEDVGLKTYGSYTNPEELSTDIEVKYEAGALNCWIAALLYLATFCFSAQQFYLHEKVSILNDIKSFGYGSVERND